MATIFSLYHIQSAGLNPLQLVVVGAVLEGACFLSEIPTGVVADMYSRKLSLIIGLVVMGLGLMLEGALPIFATILLAQVVWGMGATFLSGADVAWLTDEVGMGAVGPVLMRGAQVSNLAGIGGIVVSVLLAPAGLHIPVLASGAGLLLLGLLLALTLKESKRPQPQQKQGHLIKDYLTQVKKGANHVRGHHALVPLFLVIWLGGLYNEGIDRLWVYKLTEDVGLPVIEGMNPLYWFALIQIVLQLLNFATLRFLESRITRWSPARLYLVMALNNAVLLVAMVAFGLAAGFAWSLSAYWLLMVCRGSNDPIATLLVNNNIQDTSIRATVLSMKGLADQVGQILGGLAVGAIALNYGVTTGLLASTVVIFPIIFILLSKRPSQ